MATFQVLPVAFEPDSWSKSIRRFELFHQTYSLQGKAEESQIETLICKIGTVIKQMIFCLLSDYVMMTKSEMRPTIICDYDCSYTGLFE